MKYLLPIPPNMVHGSTGGRDPRLKTTALEQGQFVRCIDMTYIQITFC